MHRPLAAFAALLLSLAWLTGCASYTEETREIRSLYRGESYKAALEKLEASSLKEESKNRLLYRLEKAMILDRLGEGAKARALLIEADKIADELYTTSITKTAASFVVNDSATDYEGEDYERVAIHLQLALSFLGDKDLKSARVEARKMNNVLEVINSKYEDHKNRYAEDAFSRYLSGTIYEALGEWDEAIIDYSKAIESYQGNFAPFVSGGVPDDLVEAYYRLLVKRGRTDRIAKIEKEFPKLTAATKAKLKEDEGTGEVVVVHELGHIATKSTQEFVLGVGKQVVRFSFPVIRKREGAYYGHTGATDEQSGKRYEGENASDLDSIAQFCLDDRRGRMVAKGMARLLAKGQLTEQAYKNFGVLGGIAANVYSVVTETADTRSWTLLPEKYMVTRFRLKPGKHTLKLETGGRTGKIETVEVEKGKVVILRDVG